MAGVFSFDEGLRIVTRQAELLKRRCHGGLLSVLAQAEIFERRPDIFDGVWLAGVNYDENSC